MGWPEKSKKQSEKRSEKQNFSADFFRRIFPRIFSVCVSLRSENGKRRRKTASQNFNIKIHHGMMIQSRMPTRWSCKPNQCAYGSSKQDLEKRIFSSTRSSAPLLPPTLLFFCFSLHILVDVQKTPKKAGMSAHFLSKKTKMTIFHGY